MATFDRDSEEGRSRSERPFYLPIVVFPARFVLLKIATLSMDEKLSAEHVKELYAMARHYEEELLISADPEEQRWLRDVISRIRACIVEIENP